MVSYVLFRDWERFGPLLLRHPSLPAADTLFGSFLLISAGPDTTLAYVSVCTPSWPAWSTAGAARPASPPLQSLILLLVHATLKADRHAPVAEALLLPGLCVIAGAMGSTLRNLMLRFGAATQALTTVQARPRGGGGGERGTRPAGPRDARLRGQDPLRRRSGGGRPGHHGLDRDPRPGPHQGTGGTGVPLGAQGGGGSPGNC